MMEFDYFKSKADAEVAETVRFNKSLQELRELRSQLHQAADYCETTFSKSQEKSEVVENTKEYICKTMVTVVDHLGNVSANLGGLISQTNAFSEAELRIQCLQQRLGSCEHYGRGFSLPRLQSTHSSHTFHSRYLSPGAPLEKSSSKKVVRDCESEVPAKIEDNHEEEETHEDLPLFMYTHKPPVQNLKPTNHNNLAMGRTTPKRLDATEDHCMVVTSYGSYGVLNEPNEN
ncbi:hypothetical protein RJT34_04714 [Clitoria ternatea]|uniref:Protein ABIL5 n=1 Tax=Clitoria ternatea TaxID=43366 RepID=A0AAN9Q0T4_CLITE